MKVLIPNKNFIPTKDFSAYLIELGYSQYNFTNCNNMWFDQKVIKFIEEHKNWQPLGYISLIAMKGTVSINFKSCFCGAVYVLEVDNTKPWSFNYDSKDIPYIVYPEVKINEMNYWEVKFKK